MERTNSPKKKIVTPPPPKTPPVNKKQDALKKSDPTKFEKIAALGGPRFPPPIAGTFFEGEPLLVTLADDLGNKSKTLALWNVVTGKKMRTFAGDINPYAHGVAFSASGRFVAANVPGEKAGKVDVWDLKTASHMRWDDPGGDVRCLEFTPDEKHLLVVANKVIGETVTLWSLEKQSPAKDLSKHFPFVNHIAISRNGQQLAANAFDDATEKTSLIKIWDMSAQKFVGELKGHKTDIARMAFSRDGKLLASGERDGTIKLWDLAAGKELHSWPQKGWVTALSFSPDGKILAAASMDQRTVKLHAHLYDTAAKKALFHLDGHTRRIDWFSWHPAGNRLLSSGTGEAVLWNVPNKW